MGTDTQQRANFPRKNEADGIAGKDNNLPVPSNAQLEGAREKADIVKQQITIDLHQRKLSQTEIAEKMGITRQTVASVLASDSYFTEKHAVLFFIKNNQAMGSYCFFLLAGISETDKSRSGVKVSNFPRAEDSNLLSIIASWEVTQAHERTEN